jgi:hypothetical protein
MDLGFAMELVEYPASIFDNEDVFLAFLSSFFPLRYLRWGFVDDL